MKILVIGSGGREHAMAWRICQTPGVTKVFVAPGNGGTALEAKMENVPISDLTFETSQRERSPLKEVARWNA